MIHVTDSVTACNLLTGVEPILVAAPAGTGAMTLSVERRRRLPRCRRRW